MGTWSKRLAAVAVAGVVLSAFALVDDAFNVMDIDDDRARTQLEVALAELERIERGESQADRWQVEQRIRHAENQLEVYSGGGGGRIRPVAPSG